MGVLTDQGTYRRYPRDSWRRLKTRSENRRLLAVLREVAAWREEEAQSRDLTRNRIIKDESIVEIAANAPTTIDDLARSRRMQHGFAEGRMGHAILAAVTHGPELPASECPNHPDEAEV